MRANAHQQLARALKRTAELLGVTEADYCFEGRFRFELGEDWSLVVSLDDAERLRLEVCLLSRVVSTLWTLADDRGRLEKLISGAQRETAALILT